METSDIEGFFREAPVQITDNERLREPQRHAHEAVLRHFAGSHAHAMLQIPVGCGKTGVMGLVPFGLARGRVLVIVPNPEIRKGVAKELDYQNPECFWTKTGVLTDFSRGPHRAVLDGKDANLADCRAAHFVIANIQQLASSADRWLPQFPDDFFDLILVDEAHHNVAASWRRVFDRFPNAKVVSLTATPFRSDGRQVEGESIFRYPFAQAMRKGYIKQLQAVQVAPSRIHFTYLGEEREHTLEEVLALREEQWFRKGVALSRETNISIVDGSIKALRRLRQSGHQHQIIAAACSINHAKEVASLYRERGYKAEAIYSEMPDEARTRVLDDLKSGKLDCIVQIQILGEGFDHPSLSVAGIFRPFRSLSPYVQFVGRIMRVVRQNAPFDMDNEGFVVSHVGLQQDERWDDFRRFDRDDQLLFAELLGDGVDLDALPEPSGDRRRVRPDMVVLDEIVERFITNDFIDPLDEGAIDEFVRQVPRLFGVDIEEMGLSREDLVARLLIARRRAELRPEKLPVQPQEARKQRRRRLDEETRSVAGRMLQALGLAPQAPDLVRLHPGLGATNNLAAAIRLLHRRVNEVMGFDPGGGRELDLAQLDGAIVRLDEFGDDVQSGLRDRMGGKH
ncbi:MAG: DEAD/DEAH box helicase family protein [Salinibacterium sp.]|nr:DEAD/DEAH box helicase family protein [Salinibacterium sp.]